MIFMDVLSHEAIYGLIGVFSGLIAGAFGIGGGIIVVPMLIFFFQVTQLIPQEMIMQVAAGSSLLIMIFTSLASLKAHAQLGELSWSVYHKLWPGMASGVCIGALLAKIIATLWLHILFALLLFFVAFKMTRTAHKIHTNKVPHYWLNHLITSLIGVTSGLLGVGGGILIIPYLTYCGVPARKIAPVSNICTLTAGIIGSIVFMFTGINEMATISYSTGFIYWPAVLGIAIPSCLVASFGARLNYVLPVQYLRYGFIVILLFTALKMLRSVDLFTVLAKIG